MFVEISFFGLSTGYVARVPYGPQHLIITLSDKSFNISVCRAYIQLADAMLWCGYTRYLGTNTANLPITHAHVQ